MCSYLPPPGQPVRESTTQNRSNDTSDAEHRRQSSDVDGAFSQRHREPNDSHATRVQRRSSRTSDRAPNDEHGRACCCGAYHAADFEDDEGDEIGVLYVEVGVHFSERGLQRCSSEQVGGSVPTDIFERVEDGCDFRYGSGDDGVVDSDAEIRQLKTQDNHGQLETRRILCLVV